jgi:hypothetical protein
MLLPVVTLTAVVIAALASTRPALAEEFGADCRHGDIRKWVKMTNGEDRDEGGVQVRVRWSETQTVEVGEQALVTIEPEEMRQILRAMRDLRNCEKYKRRPRRE